MRLHEYEAADIFAKYGIPVPEGGVATTSDGAGDIASAIGGPVVVKAQVLVGGRGLAGGIVTAESHDEARVAAHGLLGTEIKGLPVDAVLVSKKVSIARELYYGVTVDGFEGVPVVLVSAEGGMSVEEAAKRFPEKIVSFPLDASRMLYPYQARELFLKLGFHGKDLLSCADVLVRLVMAFRERDALIAEINPLAVLEGGGLMAVDAVLEIDDAALFRQSGLPGVTARIANPLERMGKELGVTYVDLDGDIGIIASGAGLGMATMDIVAGRLRPANFLETGGGITDELLYGTMGLMMHKPGLRAVFINIYGGINPIHEGAKGVVRYIREHNVTIPVVAKALGNRQEETWDIFRSGGVHVVTDVATEKAVDRLVDLVGGA